jgi:hypothetical protein
MTTEPADEIIEEPGPPIAPPDPPLIAYQTALKRYDGARLVEIHAALGGADLGGKPTRLPEAIAERLSSSKVAERIVANLEHGPKVALGLFALTETHAWPGLGIALGLHILGVPYAAAVRRLLELGLVSAKVGDTFEPVFDYERTMGSQFAITTLNAHPSVLNAARTVLPECDPPPEAGSVRQVRESDGLEPILRLAAVWQRIEEAPIRQTQQRTFFKRDRERFEDDPVLVGAITDAIEPLPDMALLWIAMARSVGLVVPETGSDRLIAATPDYWVDNAVHLPQMIATRWLALRDWHEQLGMRSESSPADLAIPYIRASVLLWLARMPETSWLALEDLASHLATLAPGWNHPILSAVTESRYSGYDTLAAILLGPAYQLGLVRAADEIPSGRRVVQLTPLGRYSLAIGPPPPPRASFDHFLFVQPNFEVIAYRQGLTPTLIGQFSRFARWSQVGAALELKLTPESVYRGLEGGLSTDSMLERLSKHSSRPLPAGVAEALRTWASRRDRVTYYSSATLVEFATPEEMETARKLWPTTTIGRVPPVAISDRLLLVEDEASIPFTRFRMAGSRDYRRPAEACVDVEADGVTLSLDLGRSDLLVDAELVRFADEQRLRSRPDGTSSPRRLFVVSPASLARAAENGLTVSQMSRWFLQRTGSEMPSAIRLLLHAATPGISAFPARRPIVMTVPTEELLDGLMQHPSTGPHLGDRLGPTTAIIPEDDFEPLRKALAELGLILGDPPRRI